MEGGSAGSYSQSEVEALMALADKVFAFSFVWSLGASCSETDWEKFDEFAREELMAPLSVNMPPMGRVFDYYVDLNGDAETAGGAKGMFREFSDILPQFNYDPTLPYSQIMVPTVDTRRFSFVITSLIRVMKPIFLTGLTGTGKTVVIQNLLKSLEPMPYEDPNGMGVLSVLINFSAQTLSRVTQYSIEQKLEKKRKNLLGAPSGRKCVIFVDDVNMPIVETYGAQPPCELLRQFLDQLTAGSRLVRRNLHSSCCFSSIGTTHHQSKKTSTSEQPHHTRRSAAIRAPLLPPASPAGPPPTPI